MSDEVYVQVDNRNAIRVSLAFGFSGVIMIASAFIVVGKFSARLDRVELDVASKAPQSELNIRAASTNEKLLIITTQVEQLQLAQRSYRRD